MLQVLRVVLGVLVMSGFLASAVMAKGSFQILSITLPGNGETLWTKDPLMLDSLSMAGLEDFSQEIKFSEPYSLGAAVEINRFYQANENATAVHFDRLFYFRGERGEPGYVYYYGLVNGWSEYDHRWFRTHAEQEQVLLDWLDKAGFAFDAVPDERKTTLDWTTAGAAAVFGLGVGWLAGSRNRLKSGA